jgi:hypothetical protein
MSLGLDPSFALIACSTKGRSAAMIPRLLMRSIGKSTTAPVIGYLAGSARTATRRAGLPSGSVGGLASVAVSAYGLARCLRLRDRRPALDRRVVFVPAGQVPRSASRAENSGCAPDRTSPQNLWGASGGVPASMRSSAAFGTNILLPIFITGESPRRAAS